MKKSLHYVHFSYETEFYYNCILKEAPLGQKSSVAEGRESLHSLSTTNNIELDSKIRI